MGKIERMKEREEERKEILRNVILYCKFDLIKILFILNYILFYFYYFY